MADHHQVGGAERGPRDADAVDVGAVSAAEVDEFPLLARPSQLGVMTRDEQIAQDHVVVECPADPHRGPIDVVHRRRFARIAGLRRRAWRQLDHHTVGHRAEPHCHRALHHELFQRSAVDEHSGRAVIDQNPAVRRRGQRRVMARYRWVLGADVDVEGSPDSPWTVRCRVPHTALGPQLELPACRGGFDRPTHDYLRADANRSHAWARENRMVARSSIHPSAFGSAGIGSQ